jgi:hypothetical protein
MATDVQPYVKLFDLESREWILRRPIDARDIVASGGGSMEGPVVEVKKGRQTKGVCREEVAALKRDGWSVVEGSAEGQPEAKTEAPSKKSAPPEPPKKVDLHAFDEPALRLWVAANAVVEDDALAAMSKEQLVEILERINFEPPSGD